MVDVLGHSDTLRFDALKLGIAIQEKMVMRTVDAPTTRRFDG